MDLPGIKIRNAEVSDMDALIGLLRELFSIEEDFTFNESLQRRGFELLLADRENSCVMVAEKDQKVIGMCSVQRLISTAQGGFVGLVEDVVISKPHRGKRIGRGLLTALEAWAAINGFKRLQLLADRNNTPALGFYEKMNWKTTRLICLRKIS